MRSALAISRDGSSMWRAPRSCTQTSTSGQRWASAPAAPAWSRWMWVSRILAGTSSPSASIRVSIVDSGPGSTIASSRWWQQMTLAMPRCMTSMSRTGDHQVLLAEALLAAAPGPRVQLDEVEAGRAQRLEQPLLAVASDLRGSQHAPARGEHAADLPEVVQGLLLGEMRQHGDERGDVERVVVEREAVADRRLRAVGVEALVAHVGVDEAEVRQVAVAARAPGDPVGARVEAEIGAVDAQEPGERPRQAPAPAADVQHPVLGTQSAQGHEMRQELVARAHEVAVGAEAQTPRRDQPAAAGRQALARVERAAAEG